MRTRLALLLAAAIATACTSTGNAGPAAPDAPDPQAAAIAGTFFGSLPVTSCAEADVLLRLGADQRYTLQAHCRPTLQDLPPEQGAWSLEWNGTCARLAPGDGARAREFALPMEDLLVLASGSCIEPIDDPRGRSLHRAQPDLRGN
jgi:hypothetical protein